MASNAVKLRQYGLTVTSDRIKFTREEALVKADIDIEGAIFIDGDAIFESLTAAGTDKIVTLEATNEQNKIQHVVIDDASVPGAYPFICSDTGKVVSISSLFNENPGGATRTITIALGDENNFVDETNEWDHTSGAGVAETTTFDYTANPVGELIGSFIRGSLRYIVTQYPEALTGAPGPLNSVPLHLFIEISPD